MTNENKSSADLEREVNEQRSRLEARIGEIKDKLSPGQLLDEALSYTKHGGAHFASSLGSQISANPMPAALVGIGLAWLISSTASKDSQPATSSSYRSYDYDDSSYPYAKVSSGGLKRVSHAADEAGQWWSEFETSTGERYKAKATQFGERAGHFTDQAGKMFGGFIDDAGNRVRDFQDDAGNILSEARSWADHNWRELRHSVGGGLSSAGNYARDGLSSAGSYARDGLSNATHAARDAANNVVSGTRYLGGTVQQGTDQLSRQIVNLFDQQPLIAGALAFAVGAAVGATLPHTSQEDELLGEQGDKLRNQAIKTAGKLYEDGKQKAAELYEDATDQAEKVYGDVKDKVADLANGQSATGSVARH